MHLTNRLTAPALLHACNVVVIRSNLKGFLVKEPKLARLSLHKTDISLNGCVFPMQEIKVKVSTNGRFVIDNGAESAEAYVRSILHGFCDRDVSLIIGCCLEALAADRESLAQELLSEVRRQKWICLIVSTGAAVLGSVCYGILVVVMPHLPRFLCVLPVALPMLVAWRYARSIGIIARRAMSQLKTFSTVVNQ